MSRALMEAYVEVDAIIDSMEDEYINKIPYKLRKMFKEYKANDYNKVILDDVPLEDQNLKEETLAILAALNYQFWCESNEEKQKWIRLYSENEKKYQESLSQEFKYDELFKKEENQPEMKGKIGEEQHRGVALVIKDSLLKKIIHKLKNIFKFK